MKRLEVENKAMPAELPKSSEIIDPILSPAPKLKHSSPPEEKKAIPLSKAAPPPALKTTEDKLKSASIQAGTSVIHSKYGKGVVLRREGTGDNVKLTINFPGYGMKKLLEKYANLEIASV
jgi:DNA helicase-2/ATP-dependent DNA helicase PcrA